MVDTANPGERSPTLHDFVAWRDALKSVQDLAAYRDRTWDVEPTLQISEIARFDQVASVGGPAR